MEEIKSKPLETLEGKIALTITELLALGVEKALTDKYPSNAVTGGDTVRGVGTVIAGIVDAYVYNKNLAKKPTDGNQEETSLKGVVKMLTEDKSPTPPGGERE